MLETKILQADLLLIVTDKVFQVFLQNKEMVRILIQNFRKPAIYCEKLNP